MVKISWIEESRFCQKAFYWYLEYVQAMRFVPYIYLCCMIGPFQLVYYTPATHFLLVFLVLKVVVEVEVRLFLYSTLHEPNSIKKLAVCTILSG